MFVSKRIERANCAFVYRKDGFVMPDNAIFSGLYTGANAKGMRFVANEIMQTSVLAVPALNLMVTLEGSRLRIDEDSGQEPSASSLTRHAQTAAETLFPKTPIDAYGFNFDVYYRFGSVIPMQEVFGAFTKPEIFSERDLRTLGVQFTMDHRGRLETYFIKILDPLEIAVHVNFHIYAGAIPTVDVLQQQFVATYTDIDTVINSLKF